MDTLKLIIKGILPIVKDKLSLSSTPPVIGAYVMIGRSISVELQFQKLKYGTGEVISEQPLYGGNTVLMSKAEAVQFMSASTINGEIINCTAQYPTGVDKLPPVANKWQYLNNHLLVHKQEQRAEDVNYWTFHKDITEISDLDSDILSRLLPPELLSGIIKELSTQYCRCSSNGYLKSIGIDEPSEQTMTLINRQLGQIENGVGTTSKSAGTTPKSSKQQSGLFGMFKR